MRRNKSINAKDRISDPIRIPASTKFIKRFTGMGNKIYLGSFIISLLTMGVFVGSIFSAKLIYLVPILGTTFWGGLLFFFTAATPLIIPRRERSNAAFKLLGFAMLCIFLLNGLTLYGVLHSPPNILLQRASAAASLASMMIPVWIWNTSRKIKIESALEGESGKET